jgi:protein-S-isoprenylcysteine O-methyltransferase Ste14
MIRDHFERSGAWLFRWRSYLPVLLFGLVLLGMRDFDYPAETHESPGAWSMVCLAVGLAGLAIRSLACGYSALGTSGRVTSIQQADALNTTGIYSLVRHPLYLGNYLMWISVALLTHTFWVPAAVTLIFWLFYERIMVVEEAFLAKKFGATYARWAASTPAFIPALRLWSAPNCPFNWRRVFRRERSSVLGLTATFAAFDLIVGSLARGALHIDRLWLILVGVALAYYLVMTFEKRAARRAQKRTAAGKAAVQSSSAPPVARRKAAP